MPTSLALMIMGVIMVVVEMIVMVTAVSVHSVAPRTLGYLSALPAAPEAH